MLIVGERINSSRKGIGEQLEARNAEFFRQLAIEQVANGADLVDVNCGTLVQGEEEALTWLVDVVQATVDKPLCLDSPNPKALAAALPRCKQRVMINSITGEKDRFEGVLPLVKEYKAQIVALCIDDSGIPDDDRKRLAVATALVDKLTTNGVPLDDIFIDPLVQPLSVNQQNGLAVIKTIAGVREKLPGVHIICGLSNVSYGLPLRKLINQAFLVLALGAGLDAVILDPMDKKMISLLQATRTLLGQDAYCRAYLQAVRQGKIEV
ncbi:MAG: 5-methyltetrahydrofolate--homocysteine methyltransferase [Clostridia bacterium]|nr:5-methyltetrahydrofolate--homocysteine methyltransferase [Clostridia bacterium]